MNTPTVAELMNLKAENSRLFKGKDKPIADKNNEVIDDYIEQLKKEAEERIENENDRTND